MVCVTEILTFAMFDVSLTLCGNSCIADAQLGGMHNVAMFIIKFSLILTPCLP